MRDDVSKMVGRKIFLMGILVVMLFSFIPNVLALGITPGRTMIDYEPGLEGEVSFSVLNNDKKDMDVVFLTRGELRGIISLNKTKTEFSSSEEVKSFTYKFELPDYLSPGVHMGEVVAVEEPKQAEAGNFIGARTSVVSQLYVYSQYPGKYIEADLDVLNAEENNTLNFIVPVINRGSLGINNAKAIIDVYDPENNKIITLETNAKSIEPNKRVELFSKWKANLESGDYFAKAEVFYDDALENLEKQFSIGENRLILKSISIDEFKLGEIAKINVLVESRWNQKLINVNANLLVYENDNIIADLKSSSHTVHPLHQKELIVYWDTEGVEVGEYQGKMIINYEQGNVIEEDIVIVVEENKLSILGWGISALKGRLGWILISVVIAILLVIIILFLVKKKRKIIHYRR